MHGYSRSGEGGHSLGSESLCRPTLSANSPVFSWFRRVFLLALSVQTSQISARLYIPCARSGHAVLILEQPSSRTDRTILIGYEITPGNNFFEVNAEVIRGQFLAFHRARWRSGKPFGLAFRRMSVWISAQPTSVRSGNRIYTYTHEACLSISECLPFAICCLLMSHPASHHRQRYTSNIPDDCGKFPLLPRAKRLFYSYNSHLTSYLLCTHVHAVCAVLRRRLAITKESRRSNSGNSHQETPALKRDDKFFIVCCAKHHRSIESKAPFHSGAAPSSPRSLSSALKTSLLRAAQISSLANRTGVLAVVDTGGLLASHQGEPGSMPGRVTPGFSHVGIVPDDAVDCRVFSGISRFLRPSIPALPNTSMTHIGSRNLAVKSPPLCWRLASLDACAWVTGTARPAADDIGDDPAAYKRLQKHSARFGTRKYTEINWLLLKSTGADEIVLLAPKSAILPENLRQSPKSSLLTPRTNAAPTRGYVRIVAAYPITLPLTGFDDPAGSLPDFRMRESCRMMSPVGGFSRGSPIYPALSFRRCFTLIGSQDLDFKSLPNLFIRLRKINMI
ncbi:hypothetical protein PR048_003283 [Dryococelus australis]|uniref:Uncharacterized protein n=1 Tax=Dryococelus australis TaxID=614101 RepID=A0ABQ9IMP1_9NEOP|nr:hypothetical protein PR048_003283 [Dryococelus australis]